jgi:hypothetical protein
MEQPEEAHAIDKAATEAGIVDNASLLGAPTVTVVRSTLKVFLNSRVVEWTTNLALLTK